MSSNPEHQGSDSSRLVRALGEIGRTILETTDREEMLNVRVESVVTVARLRSLTIGVVGRHRQVVTVERQIYRAMVSGKTQSFSDARVSYERLAFDLHGPGLVPEVARTGRFPVIDGWDDRFHPEPGLLAEPDKDAYRD